MPETYSLIGSFEDQTQSEIELPFYRQKSIAINNQRTEKVRFLYDKSMLTVRR